MLFDLLGSKSAERILLFLLVNECGYASEIQRAHGIPLTPIQSILQKFEKAGVLTSELHKKTKLYRFNPAYPLQSELKALLKKAFVHLPAEEKRAFFSRKARWRKAEAYSQQKRTALCLEAFWLRLAKTQKVSIQTQSENKGYGEVHVSEKKEQLLFTENGHWVEQGIEFSNVLRWSIDRAAGLIALEHLRYGVHRPVFLFHLAPTGPNTLQSIDSHLCADDCYFGRIEFTKQHIRLLWRIIGPRKNDVLQHIYT